MQARIIISSLGAGLVALGVVGCSSTQERAVVRKPVGQTSPAIARAQNVSKPTQSKAIKLVDFQDDSGWQSVPDAPPPLDSAADVGDEASEEISRLPAETLDLSSSFSDGISLDAFQELALAHNPSIQQASAAANKVGGIRTQVGLRPNPTVGYSGQEIGNEGAAGLHAAFVSQTFVRGDKLARNQDVVGHEEQAVLWQVEAQRYRVRTDIQSQFYVALAAQERIRLAREFLSVAKKGVTVAEDRLNADVGTRPDILQSEIQVNEVELSIQRAEFDFEAAWKELVAIAGVPDMQSSPLAGSLDTPAFDRDLESVYSQIEAESPLLKAAESKVRRAKSNLHRQEIQPIPNVTGQLGLGYDDGTGDGFANVQLSLPVPFHNQNQGNISAAYSELCEASQNVQRIRMQIRSALARVIRNHQSALATVERYRSSIIPRAQESLELLLEAQEAGEIDFLRVLTARRTVFDVNQRYVLALADLAQANAQIDGLLLTGGLSNVVSYEGGDDLRGQALSGQ